MKYFFLTIKKMLRFLLKPLSFLPALCMMYLIFSFSAQTGVQSSHLSLKISAKIVSVANRVLELGLDSAQTAHYVQSIHYYVRKLAHVTEYFLLAVSISLPLYVYRLRGFWLVIAAGIFCVGFACLDEYHQSFVAGRGPSAHDVVIDSIGIFTGIYLTRMLGFIGRRTIFAPLSLERRRGRAQGRPSHPPKNRL